MWGGVGWGEGVDPDGHLLAPLLLSSTPTRGQHLYLWSSRTSRATLMILVVALGPPLVVGDILTSFYEANGHCR
jgi:hypothetical protein